MKEAMLIIDMQNMFYEGKGRRLMDKAIPIILDHIRECRRSGIPLVWIQHAYARGPLRPGHREFEMIEKLGPKETEPRVTKTFPNGFKHTTLRNILNDLAVDRLRLCGFKAEGCVLFTYRGAKKLGYKASTIRGGVASASRAGMLMGKLIYGEGSP